MRRGFLAGATLAAALACGGADVTERTDGMEVPPAEAPAEMGIIEGEGDGVVCPDAAELEAALRGTDVGGAVSWKSLTGVSCNLIWATARCVPEGDMDAAVALFSRSAKGTWVAVEAGTGGVCGDLSADDRYGIDCE